MSSSPSAAANQPVAVAPPPALPPPPAHAVYLDQLYHQPAPPVRREYSFFRRTLAWLLLLCLLTVIILFIIWVIFHPNFPKLQVSSAAISNITMTNTTVTAECTFTLILANTNRHLTTIYDRMEISLVYPSHQVLLSQIYRPPFELTRKSHTSILTNLSFEGVFLRNTVVEAMKQDLDRGSLSLGINVLAIVRHKNWMWYTRSQFMRTNCGGLIFGFASSKESGTLSGSFIDCEVYLYSK